MAPPALNVVDVIGLANGSVRVTTGDGLRVVGVCGRDSCCSYGDFTDIATCSGIPDISTLCEDLLLPLPPTEWQDRCSRQLLSELLYLLIVFDHFCCGWKIDTIV